MGNGVVTYLVPKIMKEPSLIRAVLMMVRKRKDSKSVNDNSSPLSCKHKKVLKQGNSSREEVYMNLNHHLSVTCSQLFFCGL